MRIFRLCVGMLDLNFEFDFYVLELGHMDPDINYKKQENFLNPQIYLVSPRQKPEVKFTSLVLPRFSLH